jgi:hypothetical protein
MSTMFLFSLLTSVATGAVVPVRFDIDESRSSLTWDLKFLGGTVPFLPQVPGSDTAPVDGLFSGSFNTDLNTLSVIGSPFFPFIFQPDFRSLPPGSNFGQLSSVAGTLTVPGLVSGVASVSQVGFAPILLSSEFNFDDLAIGQTSFPLASLQLSFRGLAYLNFTGLVNTQSQILIDLPFNAGSIVSTNLTRISKTKGELAFFNLDQPVSFSGLNIGGVFVPGDFRIRGNVVATFTTVPEASTVTLLSLAGIGILGIVARAGHLRSRSSKRSA